MKYNKALIILMVFILTVSCENHSKKQKNLPNVVIIYADDMGFGDVAANNPESKLKTPNLDKLAEKGVNFIDAHTSSAVCTPSRYSLVTGRYPWRSWMKYSVFNGYGGHPMIDPGRQTIGTIFQEAGYNTSIIGKWHLGVNWQTKEIGQRPRFGTVDYNKPVLNTPKQRGFDYAYFLSASLDFSPYVFIENNTVLGPVDTIIKGHDFPEYYRKGESTKNFKHEDILDHLLNKAKAIIKENAHNPNPFFLYFPITAPHKPLVPHIRFRGKSAAGWYGDFIQQVDWTVGEVLKTLDENKLSENTIVIFSSDNGSYMYQYGVDEKDHIDNKTYHGFRAENHKPNGDWRGTKADIYEGGHRVPLMIYWPGQIAPKTINQAVCISDIVATLTDMLQLKADSSQMEDSYSLLPLLEGKEFVREPIIHQSGQGALAIRQGDYKLILCNGSGGREKPRGNPFTRPYQLYNLKNDPHETQNLINTEIEMAKSMEKEFYRIVGSGLTKGNILMLKTHNRD